MTELMQFINDQLILVGTFVALIFMLISNIIGEKFKKYQDINTNNAVSLMEDKKLKIIDVREIKERTSGYINNDINIPLAQIKNKLTTLNSDDKFLIYCRSGSRSAYACKQLTKAGFTNVYNLKGGFVAWEGANMPIKK
ncbi:Rhodanese-like domain protein [hydrothermal vent metagenome]|uniref:Rhodanese-like domain protein n=1 Tax=hydrothermal vent metagenome TaxID=652676 RepID=A0A1W1CDU9_9ZZZZ